ncbi:unnamed protein product, partial [Staurois parvus]
PPVSVHQCQLSVLIHATCHQCHINATYQCPSELPFSIANQCHLSMPVSATYQCQSVLPISVHHAAYQCRLSVPPISATYRSHMSAAFQCPSVMPVNAHQCHLPVPPISVHQCSLLVPITAASLTHIS